MRMDFPDAPDDQEPVGAVVVTVDADGLISVQWHAAKTGRADQIDTSRLTFMLRWLADQLEIESLPETE